MRPRAAPAPPAPPGAPARPRAASRARALAALAAVLALAAGSYRSVLELGFLGWDTWPLIASARIESVADFFGTFTEELMDGRYPLGRFYRPVTNLAFALDWALWGAHPRGYHATDLVIALGAAAGVFALARRLFGSLSVACAAALFFALHPLHFETLPVSARRADTLAVAFTAVALACAAGAPSRRRALGALCFSAAAVASKETGLVAAPAIFALAYFAPDPGLAAGHAARLRSAARRSAGAFAALALFVGARTLVLGGLGGHAESALLAGLARAPGLLPRYARELWVPQPLGFVARAPACAAAVALWAAALGLLLAARARGAGACRRERGALAFAACWFALALAITGLSGEVQSWYGAPFLPAYALAGGWLLGRGLEGAVRGPRAAGGFALAAAGAVLATHVRFSGWFTEYATWSAVSRASESYLAEIDRGMERTRPGQAFELRGLPLGLQTRPGHVGVRSAAGLAPYSVEAYLDVQFPGRKVRVLDLRLARGPVRAAADETLVVVGP